MAGGGASRAAARPATLAEFLVGPDGVTKSGAELVWIDVLTEDGVRFADGFGGLGGCLHWPFECFEDEVEDEVEETEETEEAAESEVEVEAEAEGQRFGGGCKAPAAAGSDPAAEPSPLGHVPLPPSLGIALATLRADAPTWSPGAI